MDANIYQREGRTVVDFRKPIVKEGHHENVLIHEGSGKIIINADRVRNGWRHRWNEYSDDPDPDLVESEFIEVYKTKAWPWSKPVKKRRVKEGHFRYKKREKIQYEANNYLIIR